MRRRDWDALRDQAVPLTPSDAGLRARELCYLHVEDPDLRGLLSFLGPPGGDRPAEVSTGKRARMAAQVTGFSNATIELRKELVGEREVAYAQAMTMLEQARLTAQSQPVRGAPLSIDPNALRIRDSVR